MIYTLSALKFVLEYKDVIHYVNTQHYFLIRISVIDLSVMSHPCRLEYCVVAWDPADIAETLLNTCWRKPRPLFVSTGQQ